MDPAASENIILSKIVIKEQTLQITRDYKWLPVITSEYETDCTWLQVTASKNAGELSSITFLLQLVKDNCDLGHSQNTSGCESTYNSGNN